MAHNIPCGIIAIGNPGTGKSTLLNSLAHEVLFKSGITLGRGLIYQLDKKTNKYGTFYDTPGLADDDTYQQQAAEAIRDALREGGPFKLLFFIRLEAGRVLEREYTAMKLVLDATPEVKNNYGIVINHVSKKIATLLQEPDNWSSFLTKLFIALDKNRRCSPSNIMVIRKADELEDEDNFLIDVKKLRDVNGMTFDEFVYNRVPVVNLAAGKTECIKDNELYEKTDQLAYNGN